MNNKPYIRYIKIIFLCIIASCANYFLSTFSVHTLQIPLYLDTVFSAALCFGIGLIPALAAAILTHILAAFRDGGFTPFIVCSIAEVIIIWFLKPGKDIIGKKFPVGLLGSLLFLYIVLGISVSVLGGLVDFFYHEVFSVGKFYFSAEDTIKIGLLQNDISTLTMNIISRIPVNIVDRFMVVFGGYFTAMGLKRLKIFFPDNSAT